MEQFTVSIKDNVYPYLNYNLTRDMEWSEGFGDNCVFKADEEE